MDRSDISDIKEDIGEKIDEIEHEVIQEFSRPVILTGAVVLVLIVGLYFGYGVRTVEATDVCSQDVNICHGFSVDGDCLGLERNDTFYDSQSQCSEYDWIKHACEGGIADYVEEESMHDVDVAGKTCGEWSEIYDVEPE